MESDHPWREFQQDKHKKGRSSVEVNSTGLYKWNASISDQVDAGISIARKQEGTYWTIEMVGGIPTLVEKPFYVDVVVIPSKNKLSCFNALIGNLLWETKWDYVEDGVIEYSIPSCGIHPYEEIDRIFTYLLVIEEETSGTIDYRYQMIHELSGGLVTPGKSGSRGAWYCKFLSTPPCPSLCADWEGRGHRRKALGKICNGESTYIHNDFAREPNCPFKAHWSYEKYLLGGVEAGDYEDDGADYDFDGLYTHPVGAPCVGKDCYIYIPCLNYAAGNKTRKLKSFASNGSEFWATAGDIDLIQSTPLVTSHYIWQWNAGEGKWKKNNYEAIYIGAKDSNLRAFETDGSARWTKVLSGAVSNGLCTWDLNIEEQDPNEPPGEMTTRKVPIIYITTETGHLIAVSDEDVSVKYPEYTWDVSFGGSNPTSPVCDSEGNIVFGSGSTIYCYDNKGNELWHTAVSGTVQEGIAISSYGHVIVSTKVSNSLGKVYCFAGVAQTFEVILTDPANDDTDVPINTHIEISFSSDLNTDTLTGESLKITYEDDNLEEQEITYDYEYDSPSCMLTLTPDDDLLTNKKYKVYLTTDLTNTEGVSLTEDYIFYFTTETLPLEGYVTPPEIIKPDETFAEHTEVWIQSPTPTLGSGKWKLHFKVNAYEDEAKTQLIESLNTQNNPELFEYSPDSGITWFDFPVEGIANANYGAIIKAIFLNTGRRQITYLSAFVCADDA